MKKRIFLISIALMLLFAGCVNKKSNDAPASTLPVQQQTPAVSEEPPVEPKAYFGKLAVDGTHLVDMNGEAVQLKGLSTHGLSWYPEYINGPMLTQMREEWNCNVLRLAMYTEDYNGYCTGGEENQKILEDLIDKAVTLTEELEMYVIIDWHILSDKSPLIYKEEALVFFRKMAEKYQDKTHILYEICNEPNGDTSWGDVKAYAAEVIPVIRTYTDAVILVGTTNWSHDVDVAAADPILGVQNVMYTFHFYAASHKQLFRDKAESALQQGLPIFVSEFGICEASGSGAINETEANAWVVLMDTYKVSYVMWNLSNKDESSAMIAPNSIKTYGFTEEELSPSGKWFVGLDDNPYVPAPVPTASSVTPKGSVQAEVVDTWEANGEQYYQYRISLQNNTGENIANWQVKIEFNQSFSLSDGWNADYAVADTMLIAMPKEYNKMLLANEIISDVGFIVKSEKGLVTTKSVLE